MRSSLDQMRQLSELQERVEALERRVGWSERPVARLAMRVDDLAVKAAPKGPSGAISSVQPRPGSNGASRRPPSA